MPECSCEELSRKIEELTEEIESLKSRGGGGRAKRAPSAYNEFMGKCVKEKGKGGDHQGKFKDCAAEYRKKKAAGEIKAPPRKEEVDDSKVPESMKDVFSSDE